MLAGKKSVFSSTTFYPRLEGVDLRLQRGGSVIPQVACQLTELYQIPDWQAPDRMRQLHSLPRHSYSIYPNFAACVGAVVWVGIHPAVEES
jgi:hypothetical protein